MLMSVCTAQLHLCHGGLGEGVVHHSISAQAVCAHARVLVSRLGVDLEMTDV